MKKEMGLRIKELRESMNQSKEYFAQNIGISGQYLGMIEKGENTLSIEKLKTLCDYTNSTADYILFGKDEKILSETQNLLSDFSNEQIIKSCNVLKDLAILIKEYEI